MRMNFDVLFWLWLAMNGGCLVIVFLYLFKDHVPVSLHNFFQWGKTETNVKTSSLFSRLLHVPNSWFTHFYIVGVLWTTGLLYSVKIFCNKEHDTSWLYFFISLITSGSSYTNNIDCLSVVIGLVLLLIQVSRRLLECVCISVFTGRIHLSHYAVGIVYYVLAGASLVAPFNNMVSADWCISCGSILPSLHWTHVVAVTLFTWASLHQYNCHVILAQLRSSSSNKTRRVYRIPNGDWFEYVSSPHYFAEILIYFSLVVLERGQNAYLWLMLVFVIQNLSLGATVTQTWYNSKLKEYPRNRLRIIPFIF
ncbi:polyprenol reductase-like [Actinia tenebrosa]|uniref:Polyprenal reductase n=1 Tax=Actinia tenebrosa TaxID=6105 RepID=A0A6P8J4E5_ACTTE|nr:polyprenol reductase-like [Actinia tenebrosa]